MPNTELLKRKMEKQGMTQAKLAQELHLAASTICQKINNIRPMSLEEAVKIARMLQIADEEFGMYFFA